MLQELAQALEHFLADYGYIAIFILMLVEEAGVPLPLPNEVALMYVGYLASKGELDANLAGLTATLGASVGSTILYTLAKRGGRALIHRWGRFIHVTDRRLAEAERWIARYGVLSVPVARLTPGLRIATTIVAGILRVPLRVVVLAVLGVSFVWSFFWIHLGRALGDNWEAGAQAFERVARVGLVFAIIIAVTVLLVRRHRRRRAEVEGQEAPPSSNAPVAPDDEAEPVATPSRGGAEPRR